MEERNLRYFLKECNISFFQFVTKLGLRAVNVKQINWLYDVKETLIELSALKNPMYFPKLKLIRIVDRAFSDALKSKHDAESLVILWSRDLMEERGISVRDSENRPFYDTS